MKIAFFGATGMLGAPVANELVKAGHEIKALVRGTEKASQKLSPEIELTEGNLRNTSSVEEVLKSCDACYLNLSIPTTAKKDDWHAEWEGLQAISELAKKNGIQRLAYLSSLVKDYKGFNWWVFDVKNKAADFVKKLDIPTTIYYPCAFMETMPDRQIQGNRLNSAGSLHAEPHWISAVDYGKMVAVDFANHGSDDREYIIQGQEQMNLKQAADLFAEHYGNGIKVAHAPLWILKTIGIFNRELAYTAKILEAINEMPEPFRGQKAWDELGRPTLTIAEFAKLRASNKQEK